ncbi:MAG: hypothetical protein ACOY71_06815 [Gemmatimonadota bacterium]
MPRRTLAEKAGISRETLYRLLDGHATEKTIAAVARVLGVPAPRFVLLAEPETEPTALQLLRTAQQTIERAIALLAPEQSGKDTDRLKVAEARPRPKRKTRRRARR